MSDTVRHNIISIPPLQISIFSVESMETPMRLVSEQRTSMRPNLSNFTKQMLNMDETPSMAPVYGVALKPEQILCVSCLHPNLSKAYCLSQEMGDTTVLAQQNCVRQIEDKSFVFSSIYADKSNVSFISYAKDCGSR